MKKVELAIHMSLLGDPGYADRAMASAEAAAIDVLDQYRSKIAARDKLIAENRDRPRFGLRRPPTPAKRRAAAALVSRLGAFETPGDRLVGVEQPGEVAQVAEQMAEPPQAVASAVGLSHPSIAALLSELDAAQD